MSADTNPEAEFAYGAGHINPVKAINPGLVYDAGEDQYVEFLCEQGYSTKQLQLVTGDNNACSEVPKTISSNLNCPSFTLSAPSGQSIGRVFHRTVTNVGSAKSTYRAVVKTLKGLMINVTPDVLSFKNLGEQKTFLVTVTAKMGNSKDFFRTLNLHCRSCDGAKGECRSSWGSSCPNLKCQPWLLAI
ncbi:hypothetical protein GH714_036419 [Hevea brasiliensis]|uniref:Subtilisin-like protease fibronectin type-III domain-containing protein n=1 Tax=Hevea brasiliensis TaxID=3981 RepID=A0A6A6L956_HEVBR|nr:hypothetical protein GH714_036419 [Hevea brasiliensis]